MSKRGHRLGLVAQKRSIIIRIYDYYEALDGWSEFFTYSAEQAKAFRGKLKRIAFQNENVFEIGFDQMSFLAWPADRDAHVSDWELNPAYLRSVIAAIRGRV